MWLLHIGQDNAQQYKSLPILKIPYFTIYFLNIICLKFLILFFFILVVTMFLFSVILSNFSVSQLYFFLDLFEDTGIR